MDRAALTPPPSFSQRVHRSFGARAADYDRQAPLQRAMAWRLARHVRQLALPAGPAADLGAGTGLVGRSLALQGCSHRLLQVDACASLLARNPLGPSHGSHCWDLNLGLPIGLEGAALLTSSFALQWLADPVGQLEHWCRGLTPGGWLALVVPTSESFPQWSSAAAAARVPCTRLPLPATEQLVGQARRLLTLERVERLRFSVPCEGGREFLRQLKAIGAGTSPAPPLAPGGLRRLLQHWPRDGVVTWHLILLIGQRPA